MRNLNSILIEGNLTKDPELSYTSKGKAVCKIQLANNRSFKVDNEYQNEVSFFEVVAWSGSAENCKKYLSKGSPVRVIGRLKQERYQDDEGKNHSKIIINADCVEFLPDKSKSKSA